MKKTLLTGLKPTGSLTLGNYIGSIKQMIDNQDMYNSYLFIADMHAITVSVDREQLHKNIRDFMALYLACGIDPEKNKGYTYLLLCATIIFSLWGRSKEEYYIFTI